MSDTVDLEYVDETNRASINRLRRDQQKAGYRSSAPTGRCGRPIDRVDVLNESCIRRVFDVLERCNISRLSTTDDGHRPTLRSTTFIADTRRFIATAG